LLDTCHQVDVSKLALHYTLRNEAIATTLISSTSVARMGANLRAVREALSAEEEAAMRHVREEIFGPAGEQSWEGVEIAAYWQTVGKALLMERLYEPTAKRKRL
jgi:diketogulonate reductase-like aldo/keto reductase